MMAAFKFNALPPFHVHVNLIRHPCRERGFLLLTTIPLHYNHKLQDKDITNSKHHMIVGGPFTRQGVSYMYLFLACCCCCLKSFSVVQKVSLFFILFYHSLLYYIRYNIQTLFFTMDE